MEVVECTFKPKISESSEKILFNSDKFNGMNTYDRNLIWKRNVDKNIQNNHLIQERKAFQECLFEPQLFRKPLLTVQNVITSSKENFKNDNMYNKTKEWKTKVDTIRKHKEIENEEKRIKDATQYIKRPDSAKKLFKKDNIESVINLTEKEQK